MELIPSRSAPDSVKDADTPQGPQLPPDLAAGPLRGMNVLPLAAAAEG